VFSYTLPLSALHRLDFGAFSAGVSKFAASSAAVTKVWPIKVAFATKQTTQGLGIYLDRLDKRSVVWEYTSELATKLAQSTIADRSQVQMKRKPDGFRPPCGHNGLFHEESYL